MDLGIAGKVVFFTVGSKGMGRIAARTLADEGCKVAVVARTKGPVDDAVSEITAGGGTAIGVTADISRVRMGRPDEYARLVLAIVDNPMLNGSCIRLDGGQRFAPK
jgi:NAD(P)-dependent dehydrogenase (short-subunit alcohol dehydrogenase family)